MRSPNVPIPTPLIRQQEQAPSFNGFSEGYLMPKHPNDRNQALMEDAHIFRLSFSRAIFCHQLSQSRRFRTSISRRSRGQSPSSSFGKCRHIVKYVIAMLPYGGTFPQISQDLLSLTSFESDRISPLRMTGNGRFFCCTPSGTSEQPGHDPEETGRYTFTAIPVRTAGCTQMPTSRKNDRRETSTSIPDNNRYSAPGK